MGILAVGSGFWGTLFVAVLIIAIVALVVLSMVRDKKAGKSLQCGGNCKNCHAGCSGAAAGAGNVKMTVTCVDKETVKKQ